MVAEYVPVVRWFRENEKNKGAGFKIKPESLTCLKDRVQKEIAFLGTKGTISHSNAKRQKLIYTFSMICFPDLVFYKHFLQENTHFSFLEAQFPVGVPL